jgi:hypothetical protein
MMVYKRGKNNIVEKTPVATGYFRGCILLLHDCSGNGRRRF